jgi:GGDEF domain-containing protein
MNTDKVTFDSKMNLILNQNPDITPAAALAAALKIKAEAELKQATETALSRLNDAQMRVDRQVEILRDARRRENDAAKMLKRVDDAAKQYKKDGNWDTYVKAINARP